MSPVGIDERDGNLSISNIMPNPFEGTSAFKLQTPESGQVNIEICDMRGRKMATYENELPAGVHLFHIQLSSPQNYVLTARSGMYTASVKMMNTGNSDNNQIKYLGESKDQDLNVQTANNTKDDAHPFYVGDQMIYVGYAEVNGTEYQSQLIQQQQFASEDFIFQFQVQGDIPSEFTCGISTISDHEGNVYNTVQIGTQCWTKENMRCTTSPSTGTTILENPAYSYSFSGKKAYYVDGNANNTLGYGLLYNWCAAVDTFNTQYGEISTNEDECSALYVVFSGNRRGICPQGWHVPNPSEWITLITYVRSQSDYICGDTTINIAKALASTAGWNSSTTTCAVGNTPSHNNATGFSALPSFIINYSCEFWSATQNTNSTAQIRYLLFVGKSMLDKDENKETLCSVRCLKD